MSNSAADNKKRAERMRVFIKMLINDEYPNYNRLRKRLFQELGESLDAYDNNDGDNIDKKRKYKFVRQTLLRDIQYLESLGAEIVYKQAQNGYELQNRNWRGYATLLDEDEMEAAVLGAQFAAHILPPSQLRDKIKLSVDSLFTGNHLPVESRDVLWQSLAIQTLPYHIDPDVFQIIFEQWRSQHNVSITYTTAKNPKAQTDLVEPHILSFFNGAWYLHARSPKRGNRFFTFALHRIIKAKRDGHLFEPDTDEIAAVNYGGVFDFPLVEGIQLKLSGVALQLGAENLPVDKIEEDGDSAIVSLKPVEEYKVVNFVMVSKGEAVILAPESLINKVKDQAQAILDSMS